MLLFALFAASSAVVLAAADSPRERTCDYEPGVTACDENGELMTCMTGYTPPFVFSATPPLTECPTKQCRFNGGNAPHCDCDPVSFMSTDQIHAVFQGMAPSFGHGQTLVVDGQTYGCEDGYAFLQCGNRKCMATHTAQCGLGEDGVSPTCACEVNSTNMLVQPGFTVTLHDNGDDTDTEARYHCTEHGVLESVHECGAPASIEQRHRLHVRRSADSTVDGSIEIVKIAKDDNIQMLFDEVPVCIKCNEDVIGPLRAAVAEIEGPEYARDLHCIDGRAAYIHPAMTAPTGEPAVIESSMVQMKIMADAMSNHQRDFLQDISLLSTFPACTEPFGRQKFEVAEQLFGSATVAGCVCFLGPPRRSIKEYDLSNVVLPGFYSKDGEWMCMPSGDIVRVHSDENPQFKYYDAEKVTIDVVPSPHDSPKSTPRGIFVLVDEATSMGIETESVPSDLAGLLDHAQMHLCGSTNAAPCFYIDTASDLMMQRFAAIKCPQMGDRSKIVDLLSGETAEMYYDRDMVSNTDPTPEALAVLEKYSNDLQSNGNLGLFWGCHDPSGIARSAPRRQSGVAELSTTPPMDGLITEAERQVITIAEDSDAISGDQVLSMTAADPPQTGGSQLSAQGSGSGSDASLGDSLQATSPPRPPNGDASGGTQPPPQDDQGSGQDESPGTIVVPINPGAPLVVRSFSELLRDPIPESCDDLLARDEAEYRACHNPLSGITRDGSVFRCVRDGDDCRVLSLRRYAEVTACNTRLPASIRRYYNIMQKEKAAKGDVRTGVDEFADDLTGGKAICTYDPSDKEKYPEYYTERTRRHQARILDQVRAGFGASPGKIQRLIEEAEAHATKDGELFASGNWKSVPYVTSSFVALTLAGPLVYGVFFAKRG